MRAAVSDEVTFGQRHKGNEEARPTDISGGRAFETDEIVQGRSSKAGACLVCLSSCRDTEAERHEGELR